MNFDALIEVCHSLASETEMKYNTAQTADDGGEQWQKNTLCYYRTQLEPYVFNYLNMTYGQKLDEFWQEHNFPKKSRYAFVIVERRCHTNWWFILRNIAWAAPHFSLYIFCSNLNYDFVKAVLGNKAENVHINIWFKGSADKQKALYEYNMTFKMPAFYKLIDAEYMINFQMDSYFLQKIPDWIFTGTYYGAPWLWDADKGGNGGLAVRNISKMIYICEKEIANIYNTDGEDDYISNAIIKYRLESLPFEFRVKVFQENFPTYHTPIGVHQFWTFLHNYNINDRGEFYKNIKNLVTLIGI
jgi:hypothetical protein